MSQQNGLFEKMCRDAVDEIASGDEGWREASPNVLIMACFGMLTNHLYHKITRPLWFVAGSAVAAAISFIVTNILG